MNIPTSLSTWKGLNIIAPFVQNSSSTSFQLKIKKAMHIFWEQLPLNFQVKHFNLSFSY